MKVIVALVLAMTLGLTVNHLTSGRSAFTEPPSHTTSQCLTLQQVLMIELYPQIRSILREKYRPDFLFGNARVLPIETPDFVVSEFIVEGLVTSRNSSETVQITFRLDGTNGYKAVDINVVSRLHHK